MHTAHTRASCYAHVTPYRPWLTRILCITENCSWLQSQAATCCSPRHWLQKKERKKEAAPRSKHNRSQSTPPRRHCRISVYPAMALQRMWAQHAGGLVSSSLAHHSRSKIFWSLAILSPESGSTHMLPLLERGYIFHFARIA